MIAAGRIVLVMTFPFYMFFDLCPLKFFRVLALKAIKLEVLYIIKNENIIILFIHYTINNIYK